MLRSTFAGFNTAYLAMMISQRALDVTGQNLSNINTEGYTRQRLDQYSISPVGASNGVSQYDTRVGQGVMADSVSQIRDPFIDIQYRNQLAKVGTVDAQDSILEDIGQIFDATDKDDIAVQLNDVISQLRNLADPENTGSSSADSVVRSSCEVLLNLIHQNATAIQDVYDEMVTKVEDTVTSDINSLIQKIADLNRSIKNSQILGSPALELQDERNEALDALATYFPIEVEYETQQLGAGLSVDILNVYVKTADNQKIALISDNRTGVDEDTGEGPVTVSRDENGVECLHIKNIYGNEKYVDSDGSANGAEIEGYLIDNISDGVLKGDLDMINKAEIYDKFSETTNAYATGALSQGADVTEGTEKTVTVTYTDSNGQVITQEVKFPTGKDAEATAKNLVDAINNNETLKALFTAEGTAEGGIVLSTKNAEDEKLQVTSLVLQSNDTDTDTLTLEEGTVTTKGVGEASDTRGIQYYMKTLDVFAAQFASTMNYLNGGTDEKGKIIDASKLLFTSSDYQEGDETLNITAANIKVSDAWMKGEASIQASDGDDHNSSDNTNVQRMINALSDQSIDFKVGADTIFTGTFYEFYNTLQGMQSVDRSASSTLLTNHTTVLNYIADSKDSVSGVYMDEEVINLMKYAQAYNAASRLMTTLDEILEKLITGTGVVGR